MVHSACLVTPGSEEYGDNSVSAHHYSRKDALTPEFFSVTTGNPVRVGRIGWGELKGWWSVSKLLIYLSDGVPTLLISGQSLSLSRVCVCDSTFSSDPIPGGWLQMLQTAIWDSIMGALIGSSIPTIIVARLTQRWIERRERRHRRDELRLEVYVEVVGLTPVINAIISGLGPERFDLPIEQQQKIARIGDCLKLLGSPAVIEAYDNYRDEMYKRIDHPAERRPLNRTDVARSRDRLVDAMARDVQEA